MQTVHILEAHETQRNALPLRYNILSKVDDLCGLAVDVVIPVPDTSRVAALNLAQKLGLPYREGFIKNRYVGRTFIMPGQQMRRKNVRRKLNAMALEFSGKNVLIVDGAYEVLA